MCWDIAYYLQARGHEAILYAGAGSEFNGALTVTCHENELTRAKEWYDRTAYNAIIDLSHDHDLSRLHPELPVVNWVADTEVKYKPPCCIVGNKWQRDHFPEARIVHLGIDIDAIPFREKPDEPKHLAYCAKIHPLKGFDLALQVAEQTGLPIRFAGQKFVDINLPNYVGEINDNAALYEFLGSAYALLAPSRLDAGGRVVVEAAACGTPVITLDCTGTQYHVGHCESGFVCRDVQEMVAAVGDIDILSRAHCREWVAENHSMSGMIGALERLCEAVADGERW